MAPEKESGDYMKMKTYRFYYNKYTVDDDVKIHTDIISVNIEHAIKVFREKFFDVYIEDIKVIK